MYTNQFLSGINTNLTSDLSRYLHDIVYRTKHTGAMATEMESLSLEMWKESLSKHHQELRTGVIVRNFLPELHKLPLTDVEFTQIQNKPDNVSQVDELITVLKTKTKEHFDKFCSVLEGSGYKHWAEKLRGELNGDTRDLQIVACSSNA